MSETIDARRAAPSDEEATLAAARRVFTERGFEAATFAELAAAAGLAPSVLAERYPDKLALFTAVLVSLEKALDDHCRAASSAAFGRPMDIFMAGCRAAAEFAGRRDFARIVMIEGPAVLGEEAWLKIDHGLGLPTLSNGLRFLNPSVTEAALKPMSLMIMGAMNEIILALARGDEGVEIESSLAVLEGLLRTWAEPR
ncbi:MAG: TetR family transcriptional regulator [Caulobacter sp.]|nr:TetR family transcriptional regulator [Caulobacter sp.]